MQIQGGSPDIVLTSFDPRHAHAAPGFAPLTTPSFRREHLHQAAVVRQHLAAALNLRGATGRRILEAGAAPLSPKTHAAPQHLSHLGDEDTFKGGARRMRGEGVREHTE